jgi:hypothetical protein
MKRMSKVDGTTVNSFPILHANLGSLLYVHPTRDFMMSLYRGVSKQLDIGCIYRWMTMSYYLTSKARTLPTSWMSLILISKPWHPGDH